MVRLFGFRTRLIALLTLLILMCVGGTAQADFVFGEPENLGPTVNSAYSEGISDMSSDGLELYFESDRSGARTQGSYDIWVTKRRTVDDLWDTPVNLGHLVNGPRYDYGPCITRDSLSLYFSSNRPGALGGADIYVATRATIKDSWEEEPVNLGPTINGSAWDHCPSISADGLILVFGSTREKTGTAHPDLCYIYMTTRATIDAPWGTPVRLGPEVNPGLAYDSDYPSISADGLSLYFTRMIGETTGLWVATRTSVSEPWTRTVDLGMRGASPRFSGDGSMMYWTSLEYAGYGDTDLLQVGLQPIVDFDGDGAIDCLDICDLVDHWGTDNSLYDIGPTAFGDGVVDAQDLIVLAEHMVEQFSPVEPEAVNVNEDDDGGQVELELGQILIITLESNPATGYRWEQAENQESILEQIGEAEFKPSETGEPPLVGAGGWEILRFKAVGAGQMTLELVYHRSWEEGVEPLETFSIQVLVR